VSTLITGASGAIGRSLVRRLSGAGHVVRAGSRRPNDLRLPGVEAVQLDLATPTTFENALVNVEDVFLYAEPSAIERFVDAAGNAGVRRIVLLSSDSIDVVDPERNALARHHNAVEQALAGAACTTTILRPGGFATMALGWAPFIRSGRPVEQPFWDARLDVIHPEDIADVAELALTTDSLDGTTVRLGGPEVLSFRDQLRVLADLLGQDIEHREPDRRQALQLMAEHVPAPLVDAVFEYWECLARQDRAATRSVQPITGRPGRTFRQWATENLGSFQ
jgi:uncharacterized protein YbjT (DUF2867 family)